MDVPPIAVEGMGRRCHTSPDFLLLEQAADSDCLSGLSSLRSLSGIQPTRSIRVPRASPYARAGLLRGPVRSEADLTRLASASVDVSRFSMLRSIDVDGSALCAQLDLAEALTDDADAIASAATTRLNSNLNLLLLPESPPSAEPGELIQKLAQLTAVSPPLAPDVFCGERADDLIKTCEPS